MESLRILRHARWLGALACVLVLMAPLVGCGAAGRPDTTRDDAEPLRGGTLVVGSISDVDSWNEYLSRQTFAHDLLRRVYLRLAHPLGDSRDHPPTFEPSLAESWAASEDGRTLTFRLRDCTWSDGVPIRASDVRFTWKAQTHEAVAWAGAPVKARIRDVEVLDDRMVAFHFDAAYPDQFADATEGGILPEHVFGRVPFEQWKAHAWTEANVGSGPFLLERHEPSTEIELVRNPRYHDPELPRLDRVVVRIVPDAGNLVTQLLTAGVDYMEGVPPRDAERIRTRAGWTLLPFDEPKYDYIGWNGSRPPFDDSRVRRALTLAIDREAIVGELLYGFGRVSRGPILSFWWGADRGLHPWPHDPEQAERLLAESGFERGADGVLRRDGNPFELELTTNAGNRLREAVIVKIQDQLARIGVLVRPRSLEMKAFVQQNLSGRYDAYLGGWRFTGKIDLESLFGSNALPEVGGNNVVFYRSPRMDGLLGSLRGASDWRQMLPVLREIQHQIHVDAPYTFLYETQRLAAAGPRLRGLRIDVPGDPLARLETYWVAR